MKVAVKNVFSKVLLLVVFGFGIILLTSCQESLSEVQRQTLFLRNNDVSIIQYKSCNQTLLENGFDETFEFISEIEFGNFTVVVFDMAKNYQIPDYLLSDLYDLLKTNKKMAVVFGNSADLSRLEGTDFVLRMDKYIVDSSLEGFYNFATGTSIIQFSVTISSDNPKANFSTAVITSTYNRVTNYLASQ